MSYSGADEQRQYYNACFSNKFKWPEKQRTFDEHCFTKHTGNYDGRRFNQKKKLRMHLWKLHENILQEFPFESPSSYAHRQVLRWFLYIWHSSEWHGLGVAQLTPILQYFGLWILSSVKFCEEYPLCLWLTDGNWLLIYRWKMTRNF